MPNHKKDNLKQLIKFANEVKNQCMEETRIMFMHEAFDTCQRLRGHKGKHHSSWYIWDKDLKRQRMRRTELHSSDSGVQK